MKQPLSPYLSKPLRSLEEVLRERRDSGRRSTVGHHIVGEMPSGSANDSDTRQSARLRARSA